MGVYTLIMWFDNTRIDQLDIVENKRTGKYSWVAYAKGVFICMGAFRYQDPNEAIEEAQNFLDHKRSMSIVIPGLLEG